MRSDDPVGRYTRHVTRMGRLKSNALGAVFLTVAAAAPVLAGGAYLSKANEAAVVSSSSSSSNIENKLEGLLTFAGLLSVLGFSAGSGYLSIRQFKRAADLSAGKVDIYIPPEVWSAQTAWQAAPRAAGS